MNKEQESISIFRFYEGFFYRKKSLEFVQMELNKILKKPEASDCLLPKDEKGQLIGLSMNTPSHMFIDENVNMDNYVNELELSNFEVMKLKTNIVQNRFLIARLMKIEPEDLNGVAFNASFYVLKSLRNLDYTILLVTKNCVFIMKTMDDVLENYFEQSGEDLICNVDCLKDDYTFFSSVVLYNTKSKEEVNSHINSSW